jgi:hypothetical protein
MGTLSMATLSMGSYAYIKVQGAVSVAKENVIFSSLV